MERKQTPFDLEKTITDWKRTLQNNDSISIDIVDELEVHLRDSMDGLLTSGLSDEEAFLVASRRVGSTPSLRDEYSKVHFHQVWLQRTGLMVAGYLFISLFLKFIALDQALVGWIGLSNDWGVTAIQLPFLGTSYNLSWAGIAHWIVGLIGIGVLCWILMSLAKGKWFATRSLPSVKNSLIVWLVASVVVMIGHWGVSILTARSATGVTEFANHQANASVANLGLAGITALVLMLVAGVLLRRCRKLILAGK